MPEIAVGVGAAVEAAAAEATKKAEEIAEVTNQAVEKATKGAMDLASPAAAKIAAALEAGAHSVEADTKQRLLVIDPESMPEESRKIVLRLQELDTALADNRHHPMGRMQGEKEGSKNIKDPELEKKLREDFHAYLKLRTDRINALAKELLFLYDWYQGQPGLGHLPTHAVHFREVVSKPQKQTKGLRRVKNSA